MPDVVNMDLPTAQDMLTNIGFKEPVVVYVDSDKPKNTILSQSLEKELEYEITSEVTLEVSNGVKAPVTKDVTISLRGSALEYDCRITISRDGKQLFSGSVPKGTVSVTIPNQTAVGSATYDVVINDMDGFEHKESFVADE